MPWLWRALRRVPAVHVHRQPVLAEVTGPGDRDRQYQVLAVHTWVRLGRGRPAGAVEGWGP